MPDDTAATSPAHLPPATPQSIHLRDYWVVVYKRSWLVLASVALALGLTWVVTKNQTRLYSTSATIEMVPPRGGPKSMNYLYAPAILQDSSFLNTQLDKLRMGTTLEEAIKDAKLKDHPDFAGMTEADIVRAARGRVSARLRRGEYLVDVTVTGPNPKYLDQIANAVVQHFKVQQQDESDRKRMQRKTELDDRIDTSESKIRLKENDKRRALQNAGFSEATFEAEYSRLLRNREKFLDEMNDVRVWLIQNDATYRAFVAAREDPEQGAAALSQHPAVVANSDVKDAVKRIAQIRAEQDELLARDIGLGHDDFKRLERAVERLTGERRRIEELFVAAFITEYEGRKEEQSRLEDEVDAAERSLFDAASVKALVDEHNAEMARLTEYRRAAQREKELILPGTFTETEGVEIIARAREPDPDKPISPNKPLNYTLGGLLGLVLGIGLAFIQEYLDDTIRTKDELAKITEVPLLGVVPKIEGSRNEASKKDLFAYRAPKSTVAESYRGIRTALTLSSRRHRHRVLLLTSAGPREGKTTTVINVATVFAYSNTRTLIIDADLRKPRVHKSLDVPNERGLSNLLVSGDDPLAACQETAVDGVSVLTSGPIPPNPSELLGSARMPEIIEKLKGHFDYILIDTPPIGAVTDAAVLGTMVDGVVLVVHAGKTRRGVVGRGLDQLRYIQAPIEGVILNNLQISRGSRYYPGYYNYYYYYSYYGSGGERPRRRELGGKSATKKPADTA